MYCTATQQAPDWRRSQPGSQIGCHFQGIPWRLLKHWNRHAWWLLWWLLPTIPNNFCWKLMHPRMDLGQCCARSRKMDDTTKLPMAAEPSHLTRKTTIQISFSCWHWNWWLQEHFKEYLPYQPFLVKTDNNPLTYIMTTPNPDATSYQ